MFDNLQLETHLFEILKMFYPPKGLCEAEPNGVHLILSILLCLRKGVWIFRFSGGNPPFQNLENVLFTDGWDGMGWTGRQKCPSNFFILCAYIGKVYMYLYR